MSQFATSGAHPPPGTLIDNDALELVELVGSGGYGVVYRAVETAVNPGRKPRTFAVKVLSRTDGRRNAHIREASLHYHVSGHPYIIDLYQVLEDENYMYFVMQYARSKDLFHQILNESFYLGNDNTAKAVFLQLLDGVEYLHKMGIYHRDLKPENILCLDDGHRIAISDFGLATTDKSSVEFRTGSIYHMSPECQSGRYAEDAYSPMSNDVWSLGIILLNMVTGRNPWKAATIDDPVFQSYCRSPFNFFCSVLPVSAAFNKLLIQVLDPNWKTRMTLKRFRQEVEKIDTFYGPQVVFEGSLARCSWEVENARASAADRKSPVKRRAVPQTPAVKPFVVKERDAPPPIPRTRQHFQSGVDKLHQGAPLPPSPAVRVIKSPGEVKHPVRRPNRRPVPRLSDDTNLLDTKLDDSFDSSMESISLEDEMEGEMSFSGASTLGEVHTPYTSQRSSLSSSPSFPKTPDTCGFRMNPTVDVKIMPSTYLSPSASLSGQTHGSPLLQDFSAYVGLSFSNEPEKMITDETMLSPSASQYSLHEAMEFFAWSDSKDMLGRNGHHGASNESDTANVIMYPEIQTPAPSKPIDIASPRQRPSSRQNMFDNPYHQLSSNTPPHCNHSFASRSSPRQQQQQQQHVYPQGRVAAMRRIFEKKLPSRPKQSYDSSSSRRSSPVCRPAHQQQTGRYWCNGTPFVA